MKHLMTFENINRKPEEINKEIDKTMQLMGLKKYLIINYKLTPESLYIIKPTDYYSDGLIQYDIIYSYKNNKLEEYIGTSKTYFNILKNISLFESDNLDDCILFLESKKYNL